MRKGNIFFTYKNRHRSAILITGLLLSCTFLGACGKNSTNRDHGTEAEALTEISTEDTNTEAAISEEDKRAALLKDPAFLKLAASSSDNSALSYLSGGIFAGKKYTQIRSYGDLLLLISSNVTSGDFSDGASDGSDSYDGPDENGAYGCIGSDDYYISCTPADYDASDDYDDSDSYNGSGDYDDSDSYNGSGDYDDSDVYDDSGDYGDYGDYEEGDLSFSYSFDLYDPCTNMIIASLSEEETGSFDEYKIVGDRLVLLSSDGSLAKVYDENLSLLQDTSVPGLEDAVWPEWLSGEGCDTAYSWSYDTGSIYSISMDDLSFTSYTPDYYNTVVQTLSPSGRYLTVSGIEKDSLHSVVNILDTTDWSTAASFRESCYSFSSSSEEGFLAEESSLENTFCYFGYDGTTSWYVYPGLSEAYMIGNDRICFHTYTADYESQQTMESYLLCNMNGEVISEMTIPVITEEDGSTASCSLSSPVWLDYCGRIVFLASVYDYEKDISLDPELVIWDISDPGIAAGEEVTLCKSKEDASSEAKKTTEGSSIGGEEETESTEQVYVKTLIPDPDTYDWGDLAEENARADELEETYGISIFLGPEIPSSIDCYFCEQECDPVMVSDALDMLSTILSLYPENFFPQLCYGEKEEVRIYLTGDLYGNTAGMIDDPAAYVCEIDNCLIMVADTNFTWNWYNTLNHEISHMIDRRLQYLSIYKEDCLFSDTEWCSFNPEDFTYMYTYDGYEYNAAYDEYFDYFIDNYGTTYPTEDRAQIFGYAVECYDYGYDMYDYLYPGNPIYEKLYYYSKCIRDGFNTEGWPQVLPWETYLQ